MSDVRSALQRCTSTVCINGRTIGGDDCPVCGGTGYVPLTSKPINLSQEWVTKVTSQHGESPSVIGRPGIPDFERWVLQLNWYHSPDCTVKQPSAQCSCGLHALKSQIRQAHTDLEAEAERLTRCLAACDNGDCECPKQDETTAPPDKYRIMRKGNPNDYYDYAANRWDLLIVPRSSPADLVGALQDKVHTDGKSRPASAVKSEAPLTISKAPQS